METVQLLQTAQAGNRLVSVHTDPDDLDSCWVGFVDAVTATHVRLRAVTTTGHILGYAVRRLEDVVQVEIDSPYLQRVEALASRDGDIFEKVTIPEDGDDANRDLIRELVGTARDRRRVVTLGRFSADDALGRVVATTDLRAAIEPIDTFGKISSTVSVPWRDIESAYFETEEEQIRRFLATRSQEPPSQPPAPCGTPATPAQGRMPPTTRLRRAQGGDIVQLLREAQAENCLVSVYDDAENADSCEVGFVDALTATQVRLRAVMTTGKVLGYAVHRLDGVFEAEVGGPYLQRMAALVARDGDVFEKQPVPMAAEGTQGAGDDLLRALIETAHARGAMVTLHRFAGHAMTTGRITAITDLHIAMQPIDRYGKATRAELISWRDMEAVDCETDDEQIHRFLCTQP